MKKILLFLPLLALASCFKEPEAPTNTDLPGEQVLVLNEGNFQWENASVSKYHLEEKKLLSEDVFFSANQRPMGDVLQSAGIDGDNIWLVVNNSGRIEVVDKTSWKVVKTITNLVSPRYLCRISNEEWLLSDLYSDSLTILGVQNGEVRGRIYLKGGTEEMVLANDKVWVGNQNAHKVYEVDPVNRKLTDSLPIGFGVFAIQKDSKGRLWMASKGNKDLGIPSAIHCLDPVSKTFVFSQQLSMDPVQDLFVDENDNVFYIHGGLFRMQPGSPALPITPFFSGDNRNLYAVEVHKERVFVSDAVDFVQNGLVYILDANGNTTHEFRAGRIPNGFLYVE